MSSTNTAVPPAVGPASGTAEKRVSNSMACAHMLDQWTVDFLAMVCRLLARTLCSVRMEQLMNKPGFLKRLLLPVLSEQLLPLVASSTQRSDGLPHFVTMQVECSENPDIRPTMGAVMFQARQRCLAPLTDEDRHKFVDACKKLNGAGRYELDPCCIPYIRGKDLYMVHIAFVDGMVAIEDSLKPVKMDIASGEIPGMTYLFRHGSTDRSECYI